MSRGSPKPTAQPLEHLVARNEFHFSALDLSDSMLDLDAPRLLDVAVDWTVKGYNKIKSKLCPVGLREMRRFFFELGKDV